MMYDIQYLGIVVRRIYRVKMDFEKFFQFFVTLYSSNRLQLPLKGILTNGYLFSVQIRFHFIQNCLSFDKDLKA